MVFLFQVGGRGTATLWGILIGNRTSFFILATHLASVPTSVLSVEIFAMFKFPTRRRSSWCGFIISALHLVCFPFSMTPQRCEQLENPLDHLSNSCAPKQLVGVITIFLIDLFFSLQVTQRALPRRIQLLRLSPSDTMACNVITSPTGTTPILIVPEPPSPSFFATSTRYQLSSKGTWMSNAA